METTQESNQDIVQAMVNTSVAQLISLVEPVSAGGDFEKAKALYKLWLKVNADSPLAYMVYFNLAVMVSDHGTPQETLSYYKAALGVKPDFLAARMNLGGLYEKLGDIEAALAQWRIILDLTAPVVEMDGAERLKYQRMALNALGRVLDSQRRYPEAEVYLAESLTLDGSQDDVLHHWIGVRQRQCKWPVYGGMPHIPLSRMKSASGPLFQLALTDDAGVQLKTCYHFLARKYQINLPELVSKGHKYGHTKIRVGYVSSDLHNHAVAFLTVPLFEKADKSRFETYAFSWSTEDNSDVRKRILSSVDHYFPIGSLSDEAAAKLIREHEIDILVDLHGLTSGARPSIFSHRPAPFIVTYLGLPATTGHPQIDYILADDYLIPPAYSPFYSEKPLYIKPVFQISDDQRQPGLVVSRKQRGLPDDKIVFCCFNNNYKFTEQMFHSWLNILKRVPDSVLWLLADNESAKQNMLEFAQVHNVSAERLVFAGRVLPQDYLAQFKLADVFLDAFPFNGGTTANDVLYMDLPIITYAGMAFASRMAGALLHALGLDELIAESFEDYENLAVKYATDPVWREQIKQKLKQAKADTQLFNSGFMVQQIEQVYQQLLGE